MYICLLKGETMSIIDFIIILFLLWGAVEGFSKGLIEEVTMLAALIFGVYFAVRYSPYTEGILRDFLHVDSGYITFIALAVTFLVIVIVMYVIGKLLTKVANILTLGWINKIIGSLFGILKYMVIICVLLLVLDAANGKFEFWMKKRLRIAGYSFLFLILQKIFAVLSAFDGRFCRIVGGCFVCVNAFGMSDDLAEVCVLKRDV